MRLDLTELLQNAGNKAKVEEELQIELGEEGLALTRPVRVKLHLSNQGSVVLMDGTAETEAELQCSRCGKKFRTPLAACISEEFSRDLPRKPAKKGKGIELKAEDFVFPIDRDNTIDLGETIRQNLLLALPLKPLCEQACKGV